MSVETTNLQTSRVTAPHSSTSWNGNEAAEFALVVHRSLDPLVTAFSIANETKRLTGSDRVSVLIWRRGKTQLLAASDLEIVDPRATAVRQLETLGDQVCRSAVGEDYQTAAESAGIANALAHYREATRVTSVLAVPVFDLSGEHPAEQPQVLATHERHCAGCLVLEQFSPECNLTQIHARFELLLPHAESAFANAVRSASRPLAGFSRILETLPVWSRIWRAPRWLLATSAIILSIAALTLIPAELTIKARGRVLPRLRQHVFAGVDGVVQEIHVEQGSRVKVGQLLLVLQSSTLEYETSRVLGELQTAQSRLESVQTSLIRDRNISAADRAELDRFALEEEELKELVASLVEQQRLLQQQAEELKIRAPLNGLVTTWDADRLLASRPVERGQRLITVADLDGPWTLELAIPDHHLGHVTQSTTSSTAPVHVSFIIPGDAGSVHRAEIRKISTTAHVDESGAAVIPVTADVLADTAQFKPGVTAVARIRCGQRALGYVWFHDLIDTLRAWMWI